jgi:chorismate-pyruvate lyase
MSIILYAFSVEHLGKDKREAEQVPSCKKVICLLKCRGSPVVVAVTLLQPELLPQFFWSVCFFCKT